MRRRPSICMRVRLAERLFGNAQAMNTLLLGLAWQRGLVPVGRGRDPALDRAERRRGRAEPARVPVGPHLAERPELEDEILVHTLEAPPATLEALIEARAAALVEYQNAALADRYRALVNEVVVRETQVLGEPGRLSRAAAEGLYRVMAYKDEYEVARLHAAASYGQERRFHLSPPLIDRHRPGDGTAAQDRAAWVGRAAAVPRAAARQASARDGARPVRPPAGAAGGAGTDRAVYRRPAHGTRRTAAGYAGCRGGDRAVARHDPRLRAGEGCEPGRRRRSSVRRCCRASPLSRCRWQRVEFVPPSANRPRFEYGRQGN